MKILKIAFVYGSLSFSVFAQCGGLALQNYLQQIDVPADDPDTLEVLQSAHDCISPCGDKLCRCNLRMMQSLINERIGNGIHDVRKRRLDRFNSDLSERIATVHRMQYSPNPVASAVASSALPSFGVLDDPVYVTYSDWYSDRENQWGEIFAGVLATDTLAARVNTLEYTLSSIKDYTAVLSEISGKLNYISTISSNMSDIKTKLDKLDKLDTLTAIDTKLSGLSGIKTVLDQIQINTGNPAMIVNALNAVRDSVDRVNVDTRATVVAVQNIDSAMSSVSSDVSDIKSNTGDAKDYLFTMSSYLEDIRTRLPSNFADLLGNISTSADSVETAVNNMQTTVSGLTSDISSIDTKLSKLDTIDTSVYKLIAIASDVSSVKSSAADIKTLTTAANTVRSTMANILTIINTTKLPAMTTLLTSVDTKLSALETMGTQLLKLDSIDTKLDKLDKLETINTALANLDKLSSIASDISSILAAMPDDSSGGSTSDDEVIVQGFDDLLLSIDTIVEVQEKFRDDVLENFAKYDTFFDEYKQSWDALESKQLFLQKQEKVFDDMEKASAGADGEHNNYWAKFAELVRDYSTAKDSNPEPELLANKNWFERMEYYFHKLVVPEEGDDEEMSDFDSKESDLSNGFQDVEGFEDDTKKAANDFGEVVSRINSDILNQFGFLKKERTYPTKFTFISPGAAGSGGPLLAGLMQSGGLVVDLDQGLESYVVGFRAVICFCWGALFLFSVWRSVISFVIPAITYLINILNSL